MKKINVCICGGGSQGHISAGVIGSNNNYSVSILTRQPEKWSKNFITVDMHGKEYKAKLNIITNKPGEIIPQSDIVLFCLPGYAVKNTMLSIKGYLSSKSIVGSVFGGSGFFIEAFDIFGKELKSFALQRVPYTGRSLEYGRTAILKGYKSCLNVATHNIEAPYKMVEILRDMYHTPVQLLSHFLAVTLSNSNPLLHPVRMFVLFKNWTPSTYYSNIPYMYNMDWDDESSELWVECDQELHKIIDRLPFNGKEIPSILDYYGCKNTKELTRKIQSIEPFKNVKPHMIETAQGYQLDVEHRYFKEDIPYGMALIKSFGLFLGVPTPKIEMVLSWAQKVMGINLMFDNKAIENIISTENICQ